MEDETGWTKPVNQQMKKGRAQPRPENITIKEHRRITPKQLEILGLISRGYSNAEIGVIIGSTEETIKSHARTILIKLGARNRAHAVTRGFLLGLLSIDSAELLSDLSGESPYE